MNPTEKAYKFPKFELNSEQGGLDFSKDFTFNPKKFYCKLHPGAEVEFVCEINGGFYCRQCLPKHEGHSDRVLAKICHEVQEQIIELKNAYIAKK